LFPVRTLCACKRECFACASASHLVCNLGWDAAAGVAAAAAAAKAAGSRAPVQKVAPKKARLVCHRGFQCLADFYLGPPCRTQSRAHKPLCRSCRRQRSSSLRLRAPRRRGRNCKSGVPARYQGTRDLWSAAQPLPTTCLCSAAQALYTTGALFCSAPAASTSARVTCEAQRVFGLLSWSMPSAKDSTKS